MIALKNRLLYLIIVLLMTLSCSSSKRLSKELEEHAHNDNFFKGLVVYNPESKKELININGNKYFTPASNTKLFTFYTAYLTFTDSVIGLKYRENNDSLIIKGTADPSFENGFGTSKVLDFLKNSKKEIYLTDEHIADESYGKGWAWDDYLYDYMPENNIFPMYGNVVHLTKNRNGISVHPALFKDRIHFNDTLEWGRDLYKNNFYINRLLLDDKKIPFKTSNQLVADLLTNKIGKKVVLIHADEKQEFKDLFSVVYDSLYKEMLVTSDNFIAEQIMLQVGKKVAGAYSVSKAVNYSLKNYFPDIPQYPRWVDGSGLSRYNLFTPESLVYLLNKMYLEIPEEKLLSYFAVGGKSGTLKNYYKNDIPYIFAKTGTLSNNHNLSGYLITKKKTLLIFSFMNNHYLGGSSKRKEEMSQFLKLLYDDY